MNLYIPNKFNPFPVYYNTTGSEPPTPPGPDYQNMPFTISAMQNTTVKFSNSSITYTQTHNGGTTTGYCGSNISLAAGDTVSFVGPNPSNGQIATFSQGTGRYIFYGNIGSLINWSNTVKQKNYRTLFQYMKKLVDISNLYITSEYVEPSGLNHMFSQCSNISSAPLHVYSKYFSNDGTRWMFEKCDSMPRPCMFPNVLSTGTWTFGSTHDFALGITQANNYVLGNPNASYGANVFVGHFYACSNLQKAPIIADVRNTSFQDCFNRCSKLSAIQVQFTSWNYNYYSNWLASVSSSSNSLFIKPAALPLTRGASNIPTYWTVLNRNHDTSSPNYGQLTYAETANGHTAGDVYTGEDPYAWYYQ